MNDLEQNRIRQIENQVNALTANLQQLNTDVSFLYEEIFEYYTADSPERIEIQKKVTSLKRRVEALRSLTPRT